MPLEYSVSSDGGAVHIIGNGPIGIQDCTTVIEKVRNDSRRRAGCSVLIDLQHANCAPLHEDSLNEIMEIAGHDGTTPYGNMAIVASGATLLYAEILSLHLRDKHQISIQVFVNMNAAQAHCARTPAHAPTPAKEPH